MKAVIVVPVYRPRPDPYEAISLLQLSGVLGAYPVRLVTHAGIPPENYRSCFPETKNWAVEYFPAEYFTSLRTYNRLLTSLEFYERFSPFDHMLLHQSDAFVFRDELNDWMDQGYDYIGAPLYEYDGTFTPARYLGTGNGGFSLRKIHSAIQVLKSFKKIYGWKDLTAWYSKYSIKGKAWYFPYFLRILIGLGGNSHHRLNHIRINEDVFWGVYIPRSFDWFKVPDYKTAIQFSMEYNCSRQFEENGEKLPFGCHQWYKGEFFNFWKDKIEAQGYKF